MDKDMNVERTPSVIELEKNLLKTTWVTEAGLIKEFVPEEDLTRTQIKLLDKCINKEEFTEKQFADLKLLLNKYRLLLKKLNPKETLKAVDDAVELIKTEQEFIDLMESDEEKYLVVNLPFKDKWYEFEFEVLPLIDSRVIESLELHIDIFRDFDIDDATTYTNAVNKPPEEMSDDEKHIIEKMNRLIQEKLSTKKVEAVNNFLANQLKIKGSDSDLETRVEFWKKFHFNAKFTVFVVVQKRLGLTEISNEKLFPLGE